MFKDFRNLPIKKNIEALLMETTYSGVWKINDNNQYLKLTSEIRRQPVGIYDKDKKRALKNVVKCAKVYKKFIEEGIYHPKTQIVICKDYDSFFKKDVLSLMVLMPKLEKLSEDGITLEVKKAKIATLKKRFNLNDAMIPHDINHNFNWGYDKITNQPYYYDLHLTTIDPYVKSCVPNYRLVLKLAKRMEIK